MDHLRQFVETYWGDNKTCDVMEEQILAAIKADESPTSPVWPGESEIVKWYGEWVTSTKRSGSVLITSSIKEVLLALIQWLKERAGGGEEPKLTSCVQNGFGTLRDIRRSPSTSGGEKEKVKGWSNDKTERVINEYYKDIPESDFVDPQPPTSGKGEEPIWTQSEMEILVTGHGTALRLRDEEIAKLKSQLQDANRKKEGLAEYYAKSQEEVRKLVEIAEDMAKALKEQIAHPYNGDQRNALIKFDEYKKK